MRRCARCAHDAVTDSLQAVASSHAGRFVRTLARAPALLKPRTPPSPRPVVASPPLAPTHPRSSAAGPHMSEGHSMRRRRRRPPASLQDPSVWRLFPSEERLQAIDLLTFELGKYPEQRATPPLRRKPQNPASSSASGAAVPSASASHERLGGSTASGAHKMTSAAARGRALSSSKFASLDALSAKTGRAALPVMKTPTTTGAARTSTRGAPSKSTVSRRDTATEDIHPYTPFLTMKAFVDKALAEWAAERRRHFPRRIGHGARSRGDGLVGAVGTSRGGFLHSDKARSSAHASAPEEEEEEEVLHHFGMGARASPDARGFDGLFRQQWQDFHVTEMVVDAASPMGGVPVSRDFDFSIPPLPEGLVHAADNDGAEGGKEGDKHPPSPNATEARSAPDVKQREGNSSEEAGPDPSFFQVDVDSHLRQITQPENETKDAAEGQARSAALAQQRRLVALEKKEAALMRDSTDAHGHHSARFFLQATLHKQHVAHSVALATIAQTLRIHPRAISVAGIKDFIGDTVQRVRLENVSPTSALQANKIIANRRSFTRTGVRRPLSMTLSDFSYEAAPLSPGDLFGNHFTIVLRDVTAPKAAVQDALDAFMQNGFPNYYGCQRFSWFGGKEDAAFALLRHNWLAFAFRFLNFTKQDRSLRELLQREKKYPHAVQDEYRRNIVRRLRQIAMEPSDLDEAPFQTCPPLSETQLTGAGGGPLNTKQELLLWQLREAYFDLHAQSRRLTAQRLSSYLWNQVLTLRLREFGAARVLDGDHVAPAALRRSASSVWDRKEWHQSLSSVVTPENRHRYAIADVVHPGFSFEGIRLPENAVSEYYAQVCDRYRLDWQARHTRSGIADFCEPPRPIVRHPLNLSYEYNQAHAKLTVKFALERGCYANVAITELMKLPRCAGAEAVTVLPLPDAQWSAMGERDPGYVEALQDIYKGYEDGVGFTGDAAEVDYDAESTQKVWDLEGPLFLPEREDPFRQAHRWGSRNLLRNAERRAVDQAAVRRRLFEAPLARRMGEEELASYAGHNIPLMPNARGKKTFFKVMRRNQRYAGAPRTTPRMRRGAQKPNRSHKLPAFKTLNKDTWNVTW